MLRSRKVLAGVALLSLAVFVVSGREMARRIDEYYRTTDRRQYYFSRIDDREFVFAGKPVTIRDERGSDGGESVVVRYGDGDLRLAPTIPPASTQLPGLTRHEDWMRVLRFAESGRTSYEEFRRQVETARIRDRLAIVVRTPLSGSGRPELGEAFRKEWAFDFYELKPEGGFAHERLEFPKGRKAEPGELVEGTWQFYAALQVMPPLGRPSPRFTGDALPAMGWTLPAAAFSGLALTWSAAMLLGGRRKRP
jgi:hypothetical protein